MSIKLIRFTNPDPGLISVLNVLIKAFWYANTITLFKSMHFKGFYKMWMNNCTIVSNT